jgi:hypothetical protein
LNRAGRPTARFISISGSEIEDSSFIVLASRVMFFIHSLM